MKPINELISVIIPVYNVEAYIDECLESIVHQTYEKLEIILIDDGSTDSSGCICDDWAQKDNRIRVIHQPNGGLSKARNTALDNCSGSYICFVDSDDLLHLRTLEIMHKAMYDEAVAISCCGFNRFVDSHSVKEIILENFETYDSTQAMQRINDIGVTACAKMYRAELFMLLRYPIGRLHEDEFLIHRLLYLARKVTVTKSGLYYYRQRSGSITNTIGPKNLMDAVEAYQDRLHFIREKQWNDVEETVVRDYLEYLRKALFQCRISTDVRRSCQTELKRIISEYPYRINYYYIGLSKSVICGKVIYLISRFLRKVTKKNGYQV